jgi:MFS family permease
VQSLRSAGTRALVVVVVGLGLGVVTQILQSILPTDWSQAANAISPWLLVAFFIGAAMPDRGSAVVAGLATLVLALIGYYATTQLRYGIGGGTSALIFWGLGAAVGGPVFGLAGHTWRTGEHRYRALALGLLAAVFIAEAGYHLLVLSEPGVAVGFAVAGLLVPVVLGRSREDRLGAYVAAVPALAFGAAGFVVFIWIYDVTSRIQA